MDRFIQVHYSSYIGVGALMLLGCLAQTISCSPMPASDAQLLPRNVKEEPAEPSFSILEDIKANLQYARQGEAVTTQSMFGQLNGMMGKSLINIVMNQMKQKLRTSFSNLNISSQCKEDFKKTVTALLASESWATRMVDAAGKLGSGVLEGNIYWFGSYDECLTTTPTQVDQNNNTIQLFKTQFVITYVPMAGVPVSLQWGSCVPDSCTAKDITEVVKEVMSLANFKTTGLRSSIKQETFPLDGPAIGMITTLALLLTVLIVATGYDVVVYQPMLEQERESQASTSSDSSTSTPVEADGNGILQPDEYTPLLQVANKKNGPSKKSENINPLAKALVKISLFSNAKKILQTGNAARSMLGAVHGVRVASMAWVILGHTYFFSLSNTQNIAAFLNMVKMPSFQAIINATVSVDTFFLISGLLVAYLVLKEMREKGGPWKINWVLFYFHRIWRLTPAYMLVIACYTTLYRHLGNGPTWPGDVPEPHCKDNWWTNLLYINNFYKVNEGCMMWSWYLANDLQFYAISPIILIPLYFHFGAGLLITLTLMLISFICTGVISVQNAYPPSTVTAFMDIGKVLGFFQHLYIVPWGRIGPYLVGILVGYVLYRTEKKVTLSWYIVGIGWVLAAGCNLVILYGLYDVSNGSYIPNDVSALYNTLHRTLWACGVGWVIFACVTGYGGPVNTLLSWPPLIPFSRLTFMAYLVHPIVMQWFYQSSRNAFYLDINTVVYLFFGHFVASYGVAFVVSLAFEAPMIGLEKLIFKR